MNGLNANVTVLGIPRSNGDGSLVFPTTKLVIRNGLIVEMVDSEDLTVTSESYPPHYVIGKEQQ